MQKQNIVLNVMPEDQRRFREAYRNQVPGWYNGYVHVAVITAPGLLALWVFTQFIHNPVWWDWLAVPFGIMAHSVVEYLVHRYILHRPHKNKALHAVFSGHALNHHRFFTEKEMRVRDQRDWRAVFFPPYVMVVFILAPMPFNAALHVTLSANAGWIFCFTTVTMCIAYEFVHFVQHLDDNWFFRNIPVLNTMRRHHATHHVVEAMHEKNLSVLLPIGDWLFRTSDLNRGLVGHFFNGYSMKHLKKGLPSNLQRPDQIPPLAELSGRALQNAVRRFSLRNQT